eukprot:4417539-Lingulodinium_polyedra.AAC.1
MTLHSKRSRFTSSARSAGTVTSSWALSCTRATRVRLSSRQLGQRVQTQSALAEPQSTGRGGGTQ